MSVHEIHECEIVKFEDQVCPSCLQGKMQLKLVHDAVEGNQTVLQCNKLNPCAHMIVIIPMQK